MTDSEFIARVHSHVVKPFGRDGWSCAYVPTFAATARRMADELERDTDTEMSDELSEVFENVQFPSDPVMRAEIADRLCAILRRAVEVALREVQPAD
jgi:hypothetical protein